MEFPYLMRLINRLYTGMFYMFSNDLFRQHFSFFLVHSFGYALKKTLRSDKKSLFDPYIKHFSIKSCEEVYFYIGDSAVAVESNSCLKLAFSNDRLNFEF